MDEISYGGDEKITANQRKFAIWYESIYRQTIGLDIFEKSLENEKSWLKDPVKNFSYSYSHIFINEILSVCKIFIFPKKTEYTCTVLKLNRTVKQKNLKSVVSAIYGFIYSYVDLKNKKVSHEYVCYGPTYKSADGEYRRKFIPYNQVEIFKEKFGNYFKELQQIIEKENISLQSDSFFPTDETAAYEKIFNKELSKSTIVMDLLICTYITEFKAYITHEQPNHISDNFNEALFSDKIVKNLTEIRKKFTEQDKYVHIIFDVMRQYDYKNPNRIFNIQCGQKIIPLFIKDVEQFGDIRNKHWKEIYISKLLSDLPINGISPSFPLFINWFLIKGNKKELYDNSITKMKLDHSVIAEDVVKKLENARRGTYQINDLPSGKTYNYLSITMENLHNTVDYPIKYAEKEIIMSDYAICTINQYVGRTFADFCTTVTNSFFFQRQIGFMFTDYTIFSKYIFEYIFGFYSMNKIGLVHGDAHLNNITFKILRYYYKDLTTEEPELRNAFIIYNLGESMTTDLIYMAPHYGSYATIIDFSRSFVTEKKLLSDYDEIITSDFISMQRKKIIKSWKIEMNEYVEENKQLIEAAMLRNMDLFLKVFSAFDTFKMTKSMLNLFSTSGINVRSENLELLKKINILSAKYLTDNMSDVLNGRVTHEEDVSYPNLEILKACFEHMHLSSFKERSKDDINIVDYFCANNKIKYYADDPNKFPPNIKYDELKKAGIKIDKDSKFYKDKENNEYMKKVNPEELDEISAQILETRDERRGREVPQKADEEFLSDLVKNTNMTNMTNISSINLD